MLPPGVFPNCLKGNVVSDHLWVIYASRKQLEKICGRKICGQIKVWFTTYYSQDGITGRVHKKSCVSVKKCGFRLVHDQDVEQLNQMMMKKSIIKSTATCPTKSADDEEASPSGSGSSHQKSLFCNTYALSEDADQDELNDVVDEARPRKRKKIEVIGTDL
ncbi:hypothetical protein Pyn_05182 [Prunus yedoensis var. nudiflora]|uniref:TMV resistance protein N-like n=1 Tax=Prunus yedoensis var. nudiflora TaxID=2094558 RepID=A0A314U7R1_PRUYE|nr:hypothetical protein Pyn_05182 [Prunus yedoensis var. nudiflora]